MGQAINWLEDYHRDISSVHISNAIGKMSPVFAPPLMLKNVPSNIKGILPQFWILADGTGPGHLWTLID